MRWTNRLIVTTLMFLVMFALSWWLPELFTVGGVALAMAVGGGPALVDTKRFNGLATVKRFLGTIALTAGQNNIQLDLPRDYMYAGLLLRLRGSTTVSGGTTNGTLHDDNPMSLLSRIVVEGSGGNAGSMQLKNFTGIEAYRASHLLSGIEPQATPLASAGVAAATAFDCMIPIDFVLPGANVPPELAVKSVLDPSEWGKLTLAVDVATIAAFINGGDRTNAIDAGLSLDVTAIQAINVLRDPQMRAWRYIEQHMSRDAQAAIVTERKPNQALKIGWPYRYLFVRTLNEVTNARQPVDDLLSSVKIKLSATEVMRFSNFREYADHNRRQNKVRDAVNPGGLNALSSRNNPAVGCYMFDFAEGGRLDGILNASDFGRTGTTLDFLHDTLIATARQIDFIGGFLVPGGAR